MKRFAQWFLAVVVIIFVLTEIFIEESPASGAKNSSDAQASEGLDDTSKVAVGEVDPADFDHYDMSVEEYMGESTSERKEVAEEFVQFYELPEAVSQDFHACLSYMVRYKSDELPIGHLLGWCKQDYETDPMKLAEEYVDHDKFESNFSAWDGSHIKLERLIEDNMNDPGSYEHVETRYRLVLNSEPKHAVVTTKFRGRNAYGGMVLNTVSAKVDIEDGAVLEILSQN